VLADAAEQFGGRRARVGNRELVDGLLDPVDGRRANVAGGGQAAQIPRLDLVAGSR
jgi:hypothetical protein